ncbi:MAG TPA: hypothetical protein VMU84_15615, partial [Thermoanaerobaculia bacterium]|nr:hypothetical protein [Thermoanaerobaculia bacterium]
VIAGNVSAACGVERWSIKTGTDAGAPSINLGTYISSTIYNFHQSARPGSIPSNSRVSPRETTQYRLSGTLTKYKRETDSDYHLVIQDSAGRTMIIELPSINCVGGGSPFGSGISHARAQFDARFTATTTMKTTSTPVTIKGIGFWDFLHGQTGVAPNGIEVHPVLDITFGSSAAFAPAISSIDDLENTQLPADVVRDDDGGLVQVYRGGDAVSDAVLYHGGEILQDPSLSMVFLGKHDVRTVAQFARELRTDSLDRYGVRNFGLRVTTRELPSADITTDLDVQRALADAIESGRIQHNDENAIYVVMLEPGIDAAVGSTRDFLSYHSQFHPTDLAMRYVVVRGGLDAATTREAMFASIERAMVNPGGNGWF